MLHPRHLASAVLAAVLTAAALAAPPTDPPPPAHPTAKDLILDGSFAHLAGELQLHVTNWGLIGSRYSMPSSYSDAPSAVWPADSGHAYLWGAGLWVGAVKLGVPSVSTGHHETEILALEGPEHVIYALDWLADGATRFPFGDPDDDGDGLEDEDPFNGLDDDADGLIDEDGAGIADEMFRAEMVDDTELSQSIYPDHRPLELKIVQTSLQWSDDEVDDFVGFQYDLTNIGGDTLEDLYVGIASDFDIGVMGGPSGAGDDLVGFRDVTVEAYPGQEVPVQVAYGRDGGSDAFGWMGWVLLDHPVDPQGLQAPAALGVRSFQAIGAQGGNPANDAERYEFLAADEIDPDVPVTSDWKLLTSVGPFASLAPGETLTVAYALVAGADEAAMLRHAARARLVYEGLAFDRDGDPANGDEFLVRWIGPDEMSVPVEDPTEGGTGGVPRPRDLALDAAPNPFNPSLVASCRLPLAGRVRLSVLDPRGRRVAMLHDGHAPAGEARWTWDGRDARGQQVASGVYMLVLETEQRVIRQAVTLVK
jgi:hypothetical protein